SKIDLVFSSIYRRIDEKLKEKMTEENDEVRQTIRNDYETIINFYHLAEGFKIIEKPEDLDLNQDSKNMDVVLHLEGGDVITKPEDLEELYVRGIRSVGILYNHDNLLGGGARGDKSRGLTSLGFKIVDKIREMNMVIDIAHCNRKTAGQVIDRLDSYNKLAVTHTGLGESERLVDLDLVKKISSAGGVVGLTPVKGFFPNFSKYLDSFKMISDKIGSVKNLAIASDFGGVDSKYLFKEFDDIGKISRIAEGLSSRGGYSDEEIADIMYGNLERLVNSF
ncbi:MAG: dipeptidase, partial [Patescibacteria group bacterium]